MVVDAPRPTLLRIPFSHYCRKAEWGLTQAGIAYDVLDVPLWRMRNARRANPAEGTVPVLRFGDRLHAGSATILEWADLHRALHALPLYPDRLRITVQTWEAWADEAIGPVTRRVAYRLLHDRPSLARRFEEVPWWFSLLPARRLYLAILKHYKARRYESEDEQNVAAILEKVETRLANTATGYLFTDHPTAADYATAALLEPLVRLEQEAGLDTDDAWPDVRAFILRVRPPATSRVRRRRVRESDWAAWEGLAGSRAAPLPHGTDKT